jgi:tetratricopeptide (TPR) repeat protein
MRLVCCVRSAFSLQTCHQGLAHFPADLGLHFEEGLLHELRDDWEAARTCFERVLRLPSGRGLMAINPGLAEYKARHHLALAHCHLGNLNEAEAEWRAVIRARPQHLEAWSGLAELASRKGGTENLRELASQCDAEPRAAIAAHILRARYHLAGGDAAAARRTLINAVSQNPGEAKLRLFLCEVLIEVGDCRLAEAHLRDLLAADPNHVVAQQLQIRLRERTAR